MFIKKQITGLALSLLLPAMVATAQASTLTPAVKLIPPQQHKHIQILRIIPVHQGHTIEHSWLRALRPARHYTTDDARILAQAAILKYGEKTMKVGNIASVADAKGRQRYNILIIDKSNRVIKTLIMDPNNGLVKLKPMDAKK